MGPKGGVMVTVRQPRALRGRMANLPYEGVALVILGGVHNPWPHLPKRTLYVRVTPRNYAE